MRKRKARTVAEVAAPPPPKKPRPVRSVPTATITAVQFGVFTSTEVKKLAAVQVEESTINKHGVVKALGINDAHMGTTTRSMLCSTCANTEEFCPGHSGYIKLKEPVVNTLFLPYLFKALSCVCYACSRLLLHGDEPRKARVRKSKKPLSALHELSRRLRVCDASTGGCGLAQPVYLKQEGYVQAEFALAEAPGGTDADALDPPVLRPQDLYNTLWCISAPDLELMGLDPEHSPAVAFMWKNLLVPPCSMRPARNLSSTLKICSEDDLTIRLRGIMKQNKAYRVAGANLAVYAAPDGKRLHLANGRFQAEPPGPLRLYLDLQRAIAAYLDTKYQTGTSKQYGKERDSVLHRFTSSKAKKARVRNNVFGKRMNYSARTVITPDTYMDIDGIGVPFWMCRKLTFPERVTAFNVHRLTQNVRNGPEAYPGANYLLVQGGQKRLDLKFVNTFNYQLRLGDVVERHLQRGDWVLFNRQPSLHKMSLMAHRVVPMAGNTFRLHVGCTKPYNADYDGDEMNVSVLRDLKAVAEGRELLAVTKNTTKDGRPLVSFQQHALLGCYLLAREGVRLPLAAAQQLLYQNRYLPEGALERCRAAAEAAGDGCVTGRQLFSCCLPAGLQCSYGGLEVRDSVLVRGELTKATLNNGVLFTIAKEYSEAELARFLSGGQRLFEEFLMLRGCSLGVDDCFVAKTASQRALVAQAVAFSEGFPGHAPGGPDSATEADVCLILDKCRDFLGDEVVAFNRRKGSGLFEMVQSGAKGNPTNIIQIAGIVGQQRDHQSARISAPASRTADTARAHGFVAHSFAEGLSTEEYFCHLVGTRVGLVDTAVKTSETGYCQRKIGKAMEDITVAYDLSVRDSEGHIVQFRYGYDGFDCTFLEAVEPHFLTLDAAGIQEHYAAGCAPLQPAAGPAPPVPDALHLQRLRRSYAATRPAGPARFLFPVAIPRLVLGLAGPAPPAARPDLGPAELFGLVQAFHRSLLQEGLLPPVEAMEYVVFGALASRPLLVDARLSRALVQQLFAQIRAGLRRGQVPPNEHVGLLASQNCSEPLTQMTLNRFHYSGQKTSVNGVTRTKEILHVTKAISVPTMTLRPVVEDREGVERLAHQLLELRLDDVVQAWHCVPPTRRMDEFRGLWDEWAGVPGSRLRVLQLTLDRVKCITRRFHPKTLAERVGQYLEKHHQLDLYSALAFSDPEALGEADPWWVSLTFDTQGSVWQEARTRLKYATDQSITDAIYLRLFQADSHLSGIPGVTDFYLRNVAAAPAEAPPSWVIETHGSNLLELLRLGDLVHLDEMDSNHIHQVLEVFGIDAAQACIADQLNRVMAIDQSSIGNRHVELIAANICSKGVVAPITYQGLCTGNSSVMKKASFEKAVDSFVTGAARGQLDRMMTVSDSLAWSTPIQCGTGRVHTRTTSAGPGVPVRTRPAEFVPPTNLDALIYRRNNTVRPLTTPPELTPASPTSRPVHRFSLTDAFVPSSPTPDPPHRFSADPERFVPSSPPPG
jgi:DNA-directed RNA polymerase II subunit RPB1